MPFGTEGLQDGTALALSGGGYRASLFHCGALWRLSETGKLGELTRVSSVSGGSITSAVLGLRWDELKRASFHPEVLIARVVAPLREFCARTIDVYKVVEGLLRPDRTIPGLLEAEYARLLEGSTLQDLPDEPRFVFNATNAATGVGFRFSKPYAGDYRIGLIERPKIPLACAVAASSAFPPFLSPVVLKVDPDSFRPVPGSDLHHVRSLRERVYLTDGGVYDNLGLETAWKRCRTVLASDAGEPFEYGANAGRDWVRHGLRVLTLVVKQARAMRKRRLIERYRDDLRGAYWGIHEHIAELGEAASFRVPASASDGLASIRTRLNGFNEAEQCSLINWGYAISDAALRRWHWPELPRPAGWPYPKYALEAGLSREVNVEATIDPPEADVGE